MCYIKIGDSMIYMKFFWIPSAVWYYVVIPIVLILFGYFIFYLVYRNKKNNYYYNYVVDYVYSTLGIIFCGLLLCLLLGYSIATIQILILNNVIKTYILLDIVLIILPIIPASFLVYVIKVYLSNLKRKEVLDNNLNNENTDVNINNYIDYGDLELIKKKK